MTLILEISPETEARLQREALARGVSLEELAAQRLGNEAPWASLDKETRRARLARVYGFAAGDGRTSADFLRERHDEARREAEKSEREAR